MTRIDAHTHSFAQRNARTERGIENHMMDINFELEKLIEKYGIDRHYPAYRASRRACGYMREWLKKLVGGKEEVLFISMDIQALKLIKIWQGGVSGDVGTLHIESVDELDSHEGDLKGKKLYVVSMTRTVEILHWIWRHGYNAESVYDIMEDEGICMQMEFYRFFTPIKPTEELDLYYMTDCEKMPDGSSITLLEYHYQKMRLEHAASESIRKRINEKLFFLAICMRNFAEAERILNSMDDKAEFGRFWDEACILLSAIKKELQSRREEDIVIYWLDALAYKEAPKISWLKEKAAHSVYFHNAYTVTPWTIATCATMFGRMLEIDNLGYRDYHINIANSPLLRDIKAHGYDFHVLSFDFTTTFDAEYCNGTVRWSDTCSEILWKMLEYMMKNEQKAVFLPHISLEIHQPSYSVRKNSFDSNHFTEIQTDEMDAQLRFYDGMLGDRVKRIYMSDHGLSFISAVNRFHVLFQAYCHEWSGRETQKIFSLLDFDSILHRMMEGEGIDDCLWERDYAPVQSIDIYNYRVLKKAFNDKDNIAAYIAYKGMITREYFYLHYKTGEEMLRKLSDMDKNAPVAIYADQPEHHRQMFEKLREITGGFPKELDTDELFKYSRYMYLAHENIKKTVREFARLLNVKLAGYPDGSIALRTGGNHSYYLYAMLDEGSRKKICGIIDKSANCVCSSLEIPVACAVEGLPKRAEAIILSSFHNLGELKEEARKQYAFLEVIDVYEYMRECGYDFKNVFWWGLDSDWNVGFPMEKN